MRPTPSTSKRRLAMVDFNGINAANAVDLSGRYVTRAQAMELIRATVTTLEQMHTREMAKLERNCNQAIRQAQHDMAVMFEERLQAFKEEVRG